MANILFIDQYAVMGGAQRILVDLASAFVEGGHRVTALFPGQGAVADALRGHGAEVRDYNLMPMRAGKKGAMEKLRYFATAVKSARSIRAAAAGQRFEFMYVNGPRAMLPGVLAGRRLRLPVVAAVHLIHEGAERRLLRWCFGRPDVKLVSFCSRFAAEPFPSVGAKGKILPNWVAPEFLATPSQREESRAELGLGNGDLAIGVLGRVSKTKGQRLFLNAAMPLLEGNPRVRLLMAGGADFEDSQEELELKALAAPYGEKVRFVDKAPAIPFLDALDISVVPSIRPESFGLVAIESMARNLPVVATRRGGLQDTVVDGQTGYLVEAEAAVMQVALSKLLENPEANKMGELGRRRVETEYSPEVLIPKTLQTIFEAVA